MNWKEFFMTALAVALGIILGAIIKSKLPANLGGAWEESQV